MISAANEAATSTTLTGTTLALRIPFVLPDSSKLELQEITPSLPIQHSVRHLLDPKYHLVQPIDVWIIRDELGQFLVYDEDDLTYGIGATIAEALNDYCKSLVGELEVLRKDELLLAEPVLRKLRDLEAYILTEE